MSTSTEHAKVVLAAILPARQDLLEYAIQNLNVEFFTDSQTRNLYTMMSRYYEVANGVMSKAALSDLLHNAGVSDIGKIALYEEIYEGLIQKEVSEVDFRWSCQQLIELAAEKSTLTALNEAMQVLNHGLLVGKEEIRGHEEARLHAAAKFSEIDRNLHIQETPEGDIREEGEDFLRDYISRKEMSASGQLDGIQFGIPTLDAITGGLQPGELDLILAYASAGKTSLVIQAAWNACVTQGKNVVFVTTETLRPQVRRKLISRHSKLAKFDLPEGLNSRDLKQGRLDSLSELKLRDVVSDFSDNPEYGKCHIMQAASKPTVSGLENRLRRLQNQFNIDLVVVDYFMLFKPDARRKDSREELNLVIEEAKSLAVTFNDGKGVPILSPWQTSRQKREEAQRTGRYDMSAMGETSMAERWADIIISVLDPPQTSRYTTLSFAAIKNRDGEQSAGFSVDADYATSTFRDGSLGATSSQLSSLLGI
jgi:replicative DNA helicase